MQNQQNYAEQNYSENCENYQHLKESEGYFMTVIDQDSGWIMGHLAQVKSGFMIDFSRQDRIYDEFIAQHEPVVVLNNHFESSYHNSRNVRSTHSTWTDKSVLEQNILKYKVNNQNSRLESLKSNCYIFSENANNDANTSKCRLQSSRDCQNSDHKTYNSFIDCKNENHQNKKEVTLTQCWHFHNHKGCIFLTSIQSCYYKSLVYETFEECKANYAIGNQNSENVRRKRSVVVDQPGSEVSSGQSSAQSGFDASSGTSQESNAQSKSNYGGSHNNRNCVYIGVTSQSNWENAEKKEVYDLIIDYNSANNLGKWYLIATFSQTIDKIKWHEWEQGFSVIPNTDGKVWKLDNYPSYYEGKTKLHLSIQLHAQVSGLTHSFQYCQINSQQSGNNVNYPYNKPSSSKIYQSPENLSNLFHDFSSENYHNLIHHQTLDFSSINPENGTNLLFIISSSPNYMNMINEYLYRENGNIHEDNLSNEEMKLTDSLDKLCKNYEVNNFLCSYSTNNKIVGKNDSSNKRKPWSQQYHPEATVFESVTTDNDESHQTFSTTIKVLDSTSGIISAETNCRDFSIYDNQIAQGEEEITKCDYNTCGRVSTFAVCSNSENFEHQIPFYQGVQYSNGGN